MFSEKEQNRNFNPNPLILGQAAVDQIKTDIPVGCNGSIDLVQLDVSDETSVSTATTIVSTILGSNSKLYAIVNNAGIGPQHGTAQEIMNTNLYGVKRMVGY